MTHAHAVVDQRYQGGEKQKSHPYLGLESITQYRIHDPLITNTREATHMFTFIVHIYIYIYIYIYMFENPISHP
jgi:hypothetical protein